MEVSIRVHIIARPLQQIFCDTLSRLSFCTEWAISSDQLSDWGVGQAPVDRMALKEKVEKVENETHFIFILQITKNLVI